MKKLDLGDDLKNENLFDDLTSQEIVPDRRYSIRKRPQPRQLRAHRVKTKIGNIKRRALLSEWLVNFKCSQLVSRSEAVVSQRRVFATYS